MVAVIQAIVIFNYLEIADFNHQKNIVVAELQQFVLCTERILNSPTTKQRIGGRDGER